MSRHPMESSLGTPDTDTDNLSTESESEQSLIDHTYFLTSTIKKHRPNISVVAAEPIPDLPGPINSLPPEVLAMIFELLDVKHKGRVAQVCRSWRDYAKLTVIWCNWVVSLPAPDQLVFPLLAQRGVRRITITNSTYHHKLAIPPILFRDLPHLTHLKITVSTIINDQTVLLISTTFKALVSLEFNSYRVSMGGQVTDASITSICEGLKKLKRLALQATRITDDGIHKLAHSDLPLQYLGLFYTWKLTGASLQSLRAGKPGLQGLKLYRCPAVNGTGMESVATMQGLQYLNITLSAKVSSWQFDAIASLKSLRTLHLSNNFIDDAKVLGAVRNSPVENLLLRGSASITDASLVGVATMRHLRRLNVSGCSRLSQRGLKYLMRRNGNLTGLDISGCRGMGPGTLEVIVASQPNLRRLSINYYHVGPVRFVTAAQRLRNLIELCINGQNYINVEYHDKKHQRL